MELRTLVSEYRAEHRITMEEFAKKCGLSKGYISMLENGKNPRTGNPIIPTLPTCRMLAKGLDMTIDDFLRSIDDIKISLSDDALPSRDEQSAEFDSIMGLLSPRYQSVALGLLKALLDQQEQDPDSDL